LKSVHTNENTPELTMINGVLRFMLLRVHWAKEQGDVDAGDATRAVLGYEKEKKRFAWDPASLSTAAATRAGVRWCLASRSAARGVSKWEQGLPNKTRRFFAESSKISLQGKQIPNKELDQKTYAAMYMYCIQNSGWADEVTVRRFQHVMRLADVHGGISIVNAHGFEAKLLAAERVRQWIYQECADPARRRAAGLVVADAALVCLSRTATYAHKVAIGDLHLRAECQDKKTTNSYFLAIVAIAGGDAYEVGRMQRAFLYRPLDRGDGLVFLEAKWAVTPTAGGSTIAAQAPLVAMDLYKPEDDSADGMLTNVWPARNVIMRAVTGACGRTWTMERDGAPRVPTPCLQSCRATRNTTSHLISPLGG
jgi:hypothetical protein